MDREKRLPQMRWCLEIIQEMKEEEVWIGERCIASRLRVSSVCLSIIEDYDFVRAEDGTSSCDLSC